MDFRTALIEETKAFGDLIRHADATTPVPTCPAGPSTKCSSTSVAETGGVRRSSPNGDSSRSTPATVHDGKPPEDPDAAIIWLNEGAQLIIDAIDQVGSETRVWTFLGPRPAGWWVRRRLHEATVHRADAALALGIDLRAATRTGR